jgi:hypothetical protein
MPTDGLIDVAYLRGLIHIDPNIDDGRFSRAMAAAGRRMRGWVGDAAYNDALLEPPADVTRKEALQYAEAHLVMAFAVLGINTALRPTGIVASESVEGNTVLRYLNPNEIEKLQQQYLETAEMIARPYLTDDGTPGAGIMIETE